MVSIVENLELRPIEGRIVRPGAAHDPVRLTAEWLEGLAPATATAYDGDLQHWRNWCEEHGVDPLAARKSDVNRWITDQHAAGAAKRTVARRVSAAASWYTMLSDETDGELPLAAANPAKTKRRPNPAQDHSPTKSLSAIQARRLIAAADDDGPRSGAIVRILLDNGFRVGTITGALIENIGESDGHHVIQLKGKGGTERVAVLPPPVWAAIQRMLAARGNPAAGPLFATRTGRPVDRHQIYRDVRRLAVKAGITDRVHPHSARHTFATHAIKQGATLYQLQADMWHADPRTTEVYVQAAGLEKSTAYKVAPEFEPAGGGDA